MGLEDPIVALAPESAILERISQHFRAKKKKRPDTKSMKYWLVTRDHYNSGSFGRRGKGDCKAGGNCCF